MHEGEKGITLIALVVTIVVLLILAAITINLVLGQNGILKTTQDAGYKTGRAEFIEKAKMDATAKQIENLGSLTQSELTEILGKYGTISNTGKESILDETITSTDEKYEVTVREVWDGKLAEDNETMVTFKIENCDANCDGIYEVTKGTTWGEFFSQNSEKFGGYEHFLADSDGDFVLHLKANLSYTVEMYYFADEGGSNVSTNSIINKRYI